MAYRRAPYSGGRGMGDTYSYDYMGPLPAGSTVAPPTLADLPISNPGLCFGSDGSVVPCPAAGQVNNLLPSALGPFTAPGGGSLASAFNQLYAQYPVIVWGAGILLGVTALHAVFGGRR